MTTTEQTAGMRQAIVAAALKNTLTVAANGDTVRAELAAIAAKLAKDADNGEAHLELVALDLRFKLTEAQKACRAAEATLAQLENL